MLGQTGDTPAKSKHECIRMRVFYICEDTEDTHRLRSQENSFLKFISDINNS